MSSRITDVANAKPSSGPEMMAFINLVILAIRSEVGEKPTAEATLRQMQGAAGGTNSPTKIGTLYGNIKKQAQSVGATATANAITTSAKWFYDNVEAPSLGLSTSGSSGGGGGGGSVNFTPAPLPPQTGPEEKPFYKETWFLVGAPITAALLLGIGILIFSDD